MIIVSSSFIKYFTSKNTAGIAIFPFIILKSKYGKHIKELIFHEKVHLRQQLEMFVLLFYIWYGIEFVVKWRIYRSWDLTYRNISFEREAYANENNFKYLEKRKFWNFIYYL